MSFLKDTPIQRKIIIIVMLICSLVLLVAYAAITYNQWHSRHQLLIDSMSTLTRVIGINSSASLAFKDVETAEETLSALKSERQVILAEFFSPDGSLFATYTSKDNTTLHDDIYQLIDNRLRHFHALLFKNKHTADVENVKYGTGFLEITQQIKEEQRLVGSIRVRVSLSSIHDSLVQQTTALAFLLLIMLIVTYLLANKMQKLVSRPILHLSSMMKKVSKSNDYSLRARAEGKDELGELITGFNQMLDKIQEHEERLTTVIQNLDMAIAEAKVAKENAEQANHSKSEFLANMSHELRTPMHGILSFSAFGISKLEKVPLEKLGGYFNRIQESGNRLMGLLNNLLDLAKLEAGKMDFVFAQAGLTEVLNSCVAEQVAYMQKQGILLDVIPTECNTQGSFDQGKIGQVITNLLSNAIKFTPANKSLFVSIVEDTLKSGRREGDSGTIPALRLIVRDEGVGIPEDELKDVFDKFIQSSKTKTGAGGTGLGLAISQEIISGHQGRIWAENAPEGGAIFSFVIPVNQPKSSV